MAINPLYALLDAKAIKTIVSEQDVLAFNRADTLQTFLDGISERHLLAAPVIGDNNNVIGFVDVLDVATYFHRVHDGDMNLANASQVHLEEVIGMRW